MIARRFIGALAVALLALPVFANNTLIPAQRTRLLVVDGQDAKSIDVKNGIEMKNGRHQLVFQIRTLVRDNGDNNLYTSSPFIMSFDLKGDQTYTLTGPNVKSTRDVSRFERSSAESFSLKDQNGNVTTFEFRPLNKSGLMLGSLVDDVQKFNLTDDPAAVREFAGQTYVSAGAEQPTATQVVAPAVISTSVSTPVKTAPPQPAPEAAVPASESMLKYWYNQADTETRNKFLQWVAEENR